MSEAHDGSEEERGDESEFELGPNEKYCISCGEVISEEATTCPDCGAPQNDSPTSASQTNPSASRATAGQSVQEMNFKQAIDDKKVEGWGVKSREGDRVILVKRRYGSLTAHLILFVFTFWTLGTANLAYLAYKYFADADKMVLRKSEFT